MSRIVTFTEHEMAGVNRRMAKVNEFIALIAECRGDNGKQIHVLPDGSGYEVIGEEDGPAK